MTFKRTDNRAPDELRAVKITPGFLPNAEGSALIEIGNTRVICAASVEDKLPPHLRSQRIEGWVTAEYGMLPRSTHTRTAREVGRGPSGRTHEIQRLIGRSLRAISDRIRRHAVPAASRVGYALYDRFLKANRVEAGVRSYGEVLRLLLGTRFTDAGAPALRQ